MNTHTISFNPDGSAQCLWTEALPLHELGRLKITRATNIEFNNTTQQWEVKDRKAKFVSSPGPDLPAWSGNGRTCKLNDINKAQQEQLHS